MIGIARTLPIAEDQVGAAVFVMDEDAMYGFFGHRAEDERAEKERLIAEQARLAALGLWI